MIILEGPDSSGKTTLAHALSEIFNLPVHHFGGPPEDPAELRDRIEFMFDEHSDRIFDRIPLISEQVFSILRNWNGMNVLTKANAYYVRLLEIRPILIYCRPPEDKLVHCYHEIKEYDSEDHIKAVEANKKALMERYDFVMDSDLLPDYIVYDYTKDTFSELVKIIKSMAKERELYKLYE